MKRIPVVTLLILLITMTGNAQAPEMLNYQGVARDASGEPLVMQSVSIQFSIHEIVAAGPVVYSETHSTMTNEYGTFSLQIGNGNIVQGFSPFQDIDWSSDIHFLEVLMDASGGSNFQTIGTQQLISVPYALHAKTAESISGETLPDPLLPIPIAFKGDTLFVAPADVAVNVSLSSANAQCNSLNANGFSDWRLPSLVELNALYKQSYLVEGLDETSGAKYWSTSGTGTTGEAFTRRMDYGAPDPDPIGVSFGHNARCVRTNP